MSIVAGRLHELPLNVNARPPLSTAMQNDANGQDTDKKDFVPSMLAGALHTPRPLPPKVNAFPRGSTAAQNIAGAHDTWIQPRVPNPGLGIV